MRSGVADRRPRILCVSVDVDSAALYLALWGRSDGDAAALTVRTWEAGIVRFLDLFGELGVPATFFVVGRDLENPGVREVLRRVTAAGHEIGNHTWSHPYDLVRRPVESLRDEVVRGHDALAAATGSAPEGFRAPGYNTSPALLDVLRDLGYRYDASPLPSWPYLAVKYLVMARVRLQGGRSASIVGDPRMGVGPAAPWHDRGLLRVPCTVSPWLRLPVIGTSLVALPGPLARHLVAAAATRPLVSLELHALDLMDVAGDALPAELARQKDLAIPWAGKRTRLAGAMTRLLGTHRP
ncbi:MAG: polysaccharide deacetylase family protein, partial [Deltaproteobacteria bacterium]|nr:polysaccharide deacetylase family protein [Deltaproteobacteria bacterium]